MIYDPNLRGLCAAARGLREALLRKAAAANCCELTKASRPKAQTAVDQVIGEFLFSPENETTRQIVNNHGGSTKIMNLLTMASMTALAQAVPSKPRTQRPYYKGEAMHCRPDLYVRPTERHLELVADVGSELGQ